MSIQIPISNSSKSGTGELPDPAGASGAGLPDLSLIAEWANQLFKQGPAGEPAQLSIPPVVPPPHAPQPADARLAWGSRAPAIAGQQARLGSVPGNTPLYPNSQEQQPEKYLNSVPGGPQALPLQQAYARPADPFAAAIAPVYSESLLRDRFAAPDISASQPVSGSTGTFYFLEENIPPSAIKEVSVPEADFSFDPFTRPKKQEYNPAQNQQGVRSFYGEGQPTGQAPLNVDLVRADFPILHEIVNGKQLVWLDNAATTQKPKSVIERISYFYGHENSNIHRAAHELAARATDAYEHARKAVARFLGAPSEENIIFVRGTTEGINLIAQTFGKKYIGAGDEIIISNLEHHANIVPWYELTREVGARLKVIPVDETGQIRLDEYKKLITPRTKLVSITQVSNALGTILPVKQVIDIAHETGIPVVVDGAQAVSHMPVNVQDLDADFYVFSGHKVFGPTGIGAVYGKMELLNIMPPYQVGGNMIADVRFDQVIYQPPPAKFEAGTGNIADAVGLGAAIEYVESLGMNNIAAYEHALLEYGTHALESIPGVRLVGTAKDKASVLSFILDGYTTNEVGQALNREGIAVRTGHHCAQPILRRFGLEATVRPSLAFYNTTDEVDQLASVVQWLSRNRQAR